MTSPLSEEKPQRWDDLLNEARRHAPPNSSTLIFRLADALEEDRDRADSAQDYSRHQETELTAARQEIARLKDKLREAQIEDSAPLRERLQEALRAYMFTDTGTANAVDAILPLITSEVSARVSEAQVAVPEPEAVGVVVGVQADHGDSHVLLSVRVPAAADYSDLVYAEVGIWPALLAEQVEGDGG